MFPAGRAARALIWCRPSRREATIRALALALVLTATWLLWSGLTVVVDPSGAGPAVSVPHPLLVGFMVGSVAFSEWMVLRMGGVTPESVPVHLTARFAAYLPWLLKEIALSNLHVAQVILDPDLPIRPQLVRVRTTQSTDLGHVIHANSITITPGTVSLDVREGTILVHALTDHTAQGVQSGDMDRRVTRVEGGGR